MFTKKTRIISLLLAAVLILCPLQAALAETQTANEKITENLIAGMEKNPDGKFGVFVVLNIDDDEIRRQAKELWEKDTDQNIYDNNFDYFHALFQKDAYIKYQNDFMAKAGLTADDRIVELWWSHGEYVVLDKEQIYRIAEMDEVSKMEYKWAYPIKRNVVNYTCENALNILQVYVGLRDVPVDVYASVEYDVNQDWYVDPLDAMLALQSAVGLRTFSWPDPLPWGMGWRD